MTGAGDGALVHRIPPSEVASVVRVLGAAFVDYPVMRFVIGEAGEAYPGRLTRLVRFFVMNRALRDEPMLGISVEGELAGAATVSFPDRPLPAPPAIEPLREELWDALGAEARSRYEACGAAWEPIGVTRPHIHLNMIGVPAPHRGRGLARRLLEAVHDLSGTTAGSEGVSLTTESLGNVDLYQHLGYEVVGRATIAPDLETWSMFRPDR